MVLGLEYVAIYYTKTGLKMYFSPPVSDIVLILLRINLTEMQEKHIEKDFTCSSQFSASLLTVHWRHDQTTVPHAHQ